MPALIRLHITSIYHAHTRVCTPPFHFRSRSSWTLADAIGAQLPIFIGISADGLALPVQFSIITHVCPSVQCCSLSYSPSLPMYVRCQIHYSSLSAVLFAITYSRSLRMYVRRIHPSLSAELLAIIYPCASISVAAHPCSLSLPFSPTVPSLSRRVYVVFFKRVVFPCPVFDYNKTRLFFFWIDTDRLCNGPPDPVHIQAFARQLPRGCVNIFGVGFLSRNYPYGELVLVIGTEALGLARRMIGSPFIRH